MTFSYDSTMTTNDLNMDTFRSTANLEKMLGGRMLREPTSSLLIMR